MSKKSKKNKELISRSWTEEEKGYQRAGQGIKFVGGDDQVSAMLDQRVSNTSVFGIPAFTRGVQLIANKVSTCRAALYQRMKGNGREFATDHPAYPLLKRQANVYSHFKDVVKQLVIDALWNGNGYAFVEKLGTTPVAIRNLDPSMITPMVLHTGTKQELYFILTLANGEKLVLDSGEVIHIKGLTTSCGLIGMRLLDYANEILQLQLDVQTYSSVFFSTGGGADSWIEVPYEGTLDEETQEQMLKALRRKTSGVRQSRNPLCLTGGAQLKKQYLSNSDGQLIESRAVTLVDVANLLNLPVSKLNGMGSTNYGSLESENISITTETYEPWIYSIEVELDRVLLRDSEREEYYFEFNRDDLIRGDSTQETQNEIALFNNGLRSWKELRAAKNLPTEVDSEDVFMMAVNLKSWHPNKPETLVPPEPKPIDQNPTAQNEPQSTQTPSDDTKQGGE